ncbi:MAG TPA: PspC domain-containing protein [Patescibacteria group bacterium]|nr:PspC domain-containing protein [Patescibacteria group bacterium]
MICPQCQKEIADASNFCYFCGANMVPPGAPSGTPPAGEPRRLVRSVTDRKLGGVCAGLAEYLGMDVSLVRVLAAVSIIFYGIGLVAYLVAWIVIPEEQLAPGVQPPRPSSRRLHRSMTDRKIGGVCGGLAEFLEADVSIIRILWLLAIFLAGTGGILYLLLWIILPADDVRTAGVQQAS